MNNNITFNLMGGGKISVPKREVYGFYKDFISGDHIVQIKDEEYKELAKQAVEFVISQQKEDGSWSYSLASAGGWTDNYHTGYVLDCLEEYQKLTKDYSYSSNIENGYKFYINNFIRI